MHRKKNLRVKKRESIIYTNGKDKKCAKLKK